MDKGTLLGLYTALVMAMFIGIFLWAYSRGRKRRFDEAAALPLADDDDTAPQRENRK